MAVSGASHSPAPTETIETPAIQTEKQEGAVTDEQWHVMKQILDKVYRYRDADGHDPSRVFHKKVNRRAIPDYYEVIKEPVALSTLKARHANKEYKSFHDFVRDSALISHNAQVYNRPDAGAYVDALTLKGIFVGELKNLVDRGTISAEAAEIPDLGDLPPVETPLPLQEEEEDDEEEDEEEEDEESDDLDDEGVRRKRKRGPRSTTAITKREGGAKGDTGKGNDADPRKRRGRPPRVDTPMEARIKAVLKGLRRYRSDDGRILIHEFEKLPDKAVHADYYLSIKQPLAVEQIKRKQKRKKYESMEEFVLDIDVMFNNCKSYNEEDSNLHKDALYLQNEAHKLAEEERQRPDTDYVMEEGRLPLPNGIVHNGELWKVGDWVHLQNPNDVTKPIVAQVYRTWQDTDGEKWINACWYYRPEQTVHQYEKHFFANEVVKTGQYRDHRIDEIIDRCFVMFCTRYSRGRPRGLLTDKEVYVCDSRYNEEKHKMNKIKTWASCLPDEVRDKDYEMDLFDHIKKIKKVQSPLLHLLKDDAKDEDELPKPTWGAENAPPTVGAIYRGPRDENQSPPPQATPSPPPHPPPSTVKPTIKMTGYDASSYRKNSDVDAHQNSVTNPTPSHHQTSSQLPQFHQHSASPVPVQHPHQYTQPAANNHGQSQNHYAAPQNRYVPTAAQRLAAPAAPQPRSQDVYILPDNANLAIPHQIRDQFQQDEQGHVLFFNAPPLDTLAYVKPGFSAVAHSVRYLAEKLRAKKAATEKHQAEGLPEATEEDQPAPAKKSKTEAVDESLLARINNTRDKALEVWTKQMQQGTDSIYQDIYGEHWKTGKRYEEEKLTAAQAEDKEGKADFEESMRKRAAREKVSLIGSGVFKDDWDPRL